jgi:hypothetical protein
MNPALAARLDQARREYETNARLRRLCWAGLYVLLIYLLLVMDDQRIASLDSWRPVADRLARFEFVASNADVDYAARLEEEQQYFDRLSQRLWKADTAGLVGADFQAWLRDEVGRSGLEKTRLSISSVRPVPGLSRPLWRLEAEISAVAEPGELRSLIESLASARPGVVVERLNYSPGRGDRLSFLAVAYCLLNEPLGDEDS